MPHPERGHELMIEVARLQRENERLEGTLASAFGDLRESEKRADAAEAKCAKAQQMLAENRRDWKADEEALAAARRECEGLRAALEKAAYGLRYGEAADLSITTATMRIEAWRGIRDAYYAARAALAAPGDGEEGKR